MVKALFVYNINKRFTLGDIFENENCYYLNLYNLNLTWVLKDFSTSF